MKIKKAVKNTAIGLMVVSQMANGMVLAAPETAIKEFKPVKEVRQELQKFKGEIKLFIMKDGQRVRVDQMMQDGLRVVAGRTCIGVRDLVNAIEGARVDWDQANQIVDIEYQGKQISYPLNKPVMWNGSQMITIDVPAQVDPSISRTFLPIRNIAETLGFKVDWNQNTKEVTLTPGAGSGVTSATKPSTPNTSNLVTASGTQLPDPNNIQWDGNGKWGDNDQYNYTYKLVTLKDSDLVQEGGYLVAMKGTAWETRLQAPFKHVDSSPANPNFKIFGANTGDSRIGTAVLSLDNPRINNKNEEHYSGARMEKGIKSYRTGFGSMWTVAGKEQLEARRIRNNAEIENLLVQINSIHNNAIHKSNLVNFKNRPESVEVYDGTGLVDNSINYVERKQDGTNMINTNFNLFLFVIDTTGKVQTRGKLSEGTIIDKIVFNNGTSYIVVDIPDYQVPGKRVSGNYSYSLGKTYMLDSGLVFDDLNKPYTLSIRNFKK